MAEVVIEQLSKRYRQGGFALRGCSATMPDDCCTVIVGPSGCGKTTLLRLIAGLERPDEGEIRIGGRVVNALPPHERGVAMVFQDFPLYPHMRLRQNLAFAARRSGLSGADVVRRIDDAANALGIAHLLERRPGELSGGERQRAALGRVLVRQPACALYDEPLSNLDAGLREQLRSELKVLQRRFSATCVFVTHDQEEAMSLADQLVVMADGAIQQAGGPLELYQQPANRFVAGFIGSPAMNFLEGTVQSDDGLVVFHHADVMIRLDDARNKLMGRPVVLGIRPDALSPSGDGLAVQVRVTVVEPLGPYCNVRGETASGLAITARLSAAVSPGERLCLKVDPHNVHLFEPGEFGRAL